MKSDYELFCKLATESIERGADLLDDYDPEWYTRIDVSCLQLRNVSHCILGQVFGFYHQGLISLGLSRSSLDRRSSEYNAADYGFTVEPEAADRLDENERNELWQHMDTEWAEQVQKRIAGGTRV